MFNPVGEVFKNSSINLESSNISDTEFCEKIRSISAEQIELVADHIAEQIASNLGIVRKDAIDRMIAQKKGTTNKLELLMLLMQKDDAQKIKSDGKISFFKDEQYYKFVINISKSIKEAITENFSTPSTFLEKGLFFKLSDYHPIGILAKTAKEIDTAILPTELPLRYTIHLFLNQTLSQQQSKLTFDLVEKSDNYEFSKKSFTIDELGKVFIFETPSKRKSN